MQKIINVFAIASFVVSGAVVGGAGYVYLNKDAILDGVGAIENRLGVTWFTFLSVVWAESITATKNVYESRCSRGIGCSGYNSSRSVPIAATFSPTFTIITHLLQGCQFSNHKHWQQ